MLSRLYLVRHGEVHNPGHVVYADLPGFGLSAAGRAQAEAAASHLSGTEEGLSGTEAGPVISSPLQRALETAAPIAAALGVAVETDSRLVEWGLSTRWAGVVWKDLPHRFPGELEAYLAHPHDLPFSPEPIAEVAARIGHLVTDLGARHPGAAPVLVSHQDPVQAVRLMLTGRPPSDLPRAKPGHATVIELEPGAPWREVARWDPPVPGSGPFPP